jgi:hypothetical protein
MSLQKITLKFVAVFAKKIKCSFKAHTDLHSTKWIVKSGVRRTVIYIAFYLGGPFFALSSIHYPNGNPIALSIASL